MFSSYATGSQPNNSTNRVPQWTKPGGDWGYTSKATQSRASGTHCDSCRKKITSSALGPSIGRLEANYPEIDETTFSLVAFVKNELRIYPKIALARNNHSKATSPLLLEDYMVLVHTHAKTARVRWMAQHDIRRRRSEAGLKHEGHTHMFYSTSPGRLISGSSPQATSSAVLLGTRESQIQPANYTSLEIWRNPRPSWQVQKPAPVSQPQTKSTAGPPKPSEPVQLPPWSRFFHAGRQTQDYSVRHLQAVRLADSHRWSATSIQQLVGMFMDRALAKLGPSDLMLLAKFAYVFCDCLAEVKQQWARKAFAHHLREVVQCHFYDSWDPIQPMAICVGRYMEPTRLYSANRLIEFMADMFAEGLLTPAHLWHAVKAILDGINVIEHVYALRRLLRHATPRLWMGRQGEKNKATFLKLFSPKARAIPNDTSVARVIFGKEELQYFIEDIIGLVDPCSSWKNSPISNPPK